VRTDEGGNGRCVHAVTLGTDVPPTGASPPPAVGPGSTAPGGPGATLPSMEERYESELTRSASVLDGVDRALQRLSDGTYGTCETCGAPILDADLAGDPARRLCEQHLALG